MNGIMANLGLEQGLSMDDSDVHLPHHGDENKGDLIPIKVLQGRPLYKTPRKMGQVPSIQFFSG